MKRKNKYFVDVTLEGHESKRIYLEQSLNPKTLWNILLGGIPGLVFDGVSGAIWRLEPEAITITLQTASINGEDHQILVFSWLDAKGEPIHQAVDISE